MMFNRLKSRCYRAMTLKRRIIILILLSSLIPFLFAGYISYHTIYSILGNKITDGIHSNLKQVELSLDHMFSSLNHVSQLLAAQGTIGKKLNELLSTNNPFEQVELTNQIHHELNLITFTNPSIGLTLYYFADDDLVSFENLPVRSDFNPKRLPRLADYYSFSYFGPHVTNYRFERQYVLSAIRKVDVPNRDDVYVYIESGFHMMQSILDNGDIGHNASYLFLDRDGTIVYSQLPGAYPAFTLHSDFVTGGPNGVRDGYYWFKETSKQGWTIVTVIPEADYNQEINRWFAQIAFFSVIFLCTSLLIAWLLWQMVYRPLKNFDTEIRSLADHGSRPVTPGTNIPEFDNLLHTFKQMKEQIWNLLAEVEAKEKRRVDLEVEKLLYQINPHFLMNTLDSVHWLAVAKGQSEIGRLVKSLNKLLYYNLGKLGGCSTVGEEIDAVRQYLTLQQIRYDFCFNVRLDVDERVLSMPIPRFILQPIVENSLYHGMNDNGYVQVHVSLGRTLNISIRDNGSGMSEETIERLLNSAQPERQKAGMGIGLHYVKRVIEVHYEGKASLRIESREGEGTSVHVSLPIPEGERND